jgi:lipoyl(octanoyl) transferase
LDDNPPDRQSLKFTLNPRDQFLRVLPYGVSDGAHNMAADEVLLESAVEDMSSLRFYGWSEPTVSLGYFQAEKLRRADEQLTKLPFVRRPTGGGTLVHHHELTYALALPADLVKQRHQSWQCRMHTVIGRALASLGVSTRTVAEEKKVGSLCFQHFTPGDLVLEAAKVVGSAQRKQRAALLQHGAILLATSPHAPALPGIRELTGRMLTPDEIVPVIEQEFAAQTGWVLMASEWMAIERKRSEELVQIKYGQPSWNQKR